MSTNHQPELLIKRLDERAVLPAYQSANAAGMDLAACLPEGSRLTIRPIARGGYIAMIPTGISIALPEGYEAQVRPRSGLAAKNGVTLPNTPGTIDADYRGEVRVPLINLGTEDFDITHGMRIAQMVIAPVAQARVVEVQELAATARGAGGFGSTGA